MHKGCVDFAAMQIKFSFHFAVKRKIVLFLTFLSDSERFPAGPQLLTKLVTGQMACGAVMVPTTMFMGQVVTAFAPQQGQTQTISISQQPPQQHQPEQPQQQQQPQPQVTAMQPGQAPLAQQQTQFIQVFRFVYLCVHSAFSNVKL